MFFSALLIASAIFGQLALSQPASAETKGATAAAEADQPIADPDQSKAAADTGSSGKPDDAVKRTYNEDALKHYNRGVELHGTGFLNQAIAEYRAAIEADDRIEEAWSNLGGIYAAQKSYTKAVEAFQKALILKPDRPTTLNGFGTVLYAKGKIEDAKEKWLQAIKIDPKFASAYYNMGTALEYEKRMPEAIGTFVKALQVNPGMADAYYRVGAIYFKEGHWAQAHTMLKKAVELEPDAEWVRDAKKSLNYLDNSFASEPKEREVKMNVISPGARLEPEKASAPAVQEKAAAPESAKSTNSTVRRTATDTARPSAESEPKSVASSTDADTTSEKTNKKTGLLSRSKKEKEPKPPKEPKPAKEPKPPKEPKAPKEHKEHKEHKEKKADMFVQPDSSESEPADLKAKPEAAN